MQYINQSELIPGGELQNNLSYAYNVRGCRVSHEHLLTVDWSVGGELLLVGAYAASCTRIEPPFLGIVHQVSFKDYITQVEIGHVDSNTFVFDHKLPETARYTALVANNAEKARKDMEKVMQVKITIQETKTNKTKFGLFSKEFLRRHGLHLIGTASTWFFVDVAYYSQNLFQKEIFSAVGRLPPAKTMSALDKLFKVSFAQFLIAFCGTVPGYWVTVLLIDRIGRFVIQIMSFFFMTVFMLALAIPYHHWTLNKAGFLIMYGLTFFFANFGPNSTTFIVPAEIFPARLRSTCHGISAAAGKAGAIVGAFGFLYASQNQDKCKTDAGYPAGIGIRNSLFILSGINVLRLLCTFLVPEAKGRSLEEMSRDDEEEEQEQQQDPQSLLPL
ncbi:hypothetical protein MIMGU_mgv1a018550mg [Erythranthe guttata]|uniref:Major facilitator superfamily (MFS) profile domain-containing protein n=1 Tax=Erythranthe guttata TaxID=4155 RepID=A0A022REC0_ERYGU|nr:hypothetical protein MIMGU_mgv1a018550mg [Erythranthe guttata]